MMEKDYKTKAPTEIASAEFAATQFFFLLRLHESVLIRTWGIIFFPDAVMVSRLPMLLSETFETTVHIRVIVSLWGGEQKLSFILSDFISRM